MNVGIRELRDGLSRYVAVARDGGEVVVTDHGRAVARLVPYGAPSALEALASRGLVTLAERAKSELDAPVHTDGAVSDLIAEQRR